MGPDATAQFYGLARSVLANYAGDIDFHLIVDSTSESALRSFFDQQFDGGERRILVREKISKRG